MINSIKVFICLLLSISLYNQAFSLDCKKASHQVEKIICNVKALTELDKNFNSLYNTAIAKMSVSEKEELKNSVKHLLKARNECLNIYGLNTMNKSINVGVEDSEIYKVGKQPYQEGCIYTWYNTMNYAIKSYTNHPNLFTLPSYNQYVETYKKMVFNTGYPIVFEVGIPRKLDNKEVEYDTRTRQNINTFFFPKDNELFAKNYEFFSFYNAGTPHGQGNFGEEFVFLNNNYNIKLNPLGGSSYSCFVPINEPVVLNDQIYLPENRSFIETFGEVFGKYDNFSCYSCDKFKPDCMLSFKSLTPNQERYLMFTKEYVQFYHNDFSAKEIAYDATCVFNVLKKHSDIIKQLKLKRYPGEEEECLFIKESKITFVKQELKLCLT